MRLYLMRHAEAEDPPADRLDLQRRLTARGRRQAERAAAFLGRLGLRLDVIWHSQLARAAQTARILTGRVRPRRGLVERPGIAPLDPVGPVTAELAAVDADLLIVGHEPFLGRLAGRLLAGAKKGAAPFFTPVACGNAGPVCLERGVKGSWTLLWAMPPEMLAPRRPRRKETEHA